MGPAAPFIMAASAVVGAGMSIKQARDQKKAGAEAQELANKNAALIMAETEFEAQKLEEKQKIAAGQRRASAASSGVGGATQTAFLDAARKTEKKDLDYFREAGVSRAGMASQSGTVAKREARAMAMGSYASAAGSAGRAAGALA